MPPKRNTRKTVEDEHGEQQRDTHEAQNNQQEGQQEQEQEQEHEHESGEQQYDTHEDWDVGKGLGDDEDARSVQSIDSIDSAEMTALSKKALLKWLAKYRNLSKNAEEAILLQEEEHRKAIAAAKAEARAQATATPNTSADDLQAVVRQLQGQVAELSVKHKRAHEEPEPAPNKRTHRSGHSSSTEPSSETRSSQGSADTAATSQTTLGLPSSKPHENTADATYTKWTARGSDPAEKLTGKDCDAYFVWRFAVESRLQVDKPLYSTTELQVRYAMQQLAQPIFPYVCNWFTSKQREGTPPSLPDLFQHIENYLGVSHLAAQAELQLDDVAQRANESVSAFYHRIQTLWDRASTPNDSRYRMICRKLRPDITEPLKGWMIAQGTQCNLSALLDAARQAENLQHDINAF
ncbi:hypothetical protein KEM55_005143 [Ascosphaera atra]|nr:hypothetical protein KEM55_005143 [Ascosphaera atra]